MKTKSLILKVCATLFVLFLFGKSAEAQTWTYLGQVIKDDGNNGIITTMAYDQNTLRVGGNFASLLKPDFVTSIVTRKHLTISVANGIAEGVPIITFKNPKFVLINGELFVAGNEDSTTAKVLKLNRIASSWETQVTFSGYVNTVVNVGNKIILGCDCGVKVCDITTKIVSNTSVTQNVRSMSVSTQSDYLIVALGLINSVILDKNTLNIVGNAPNDINIIYSVGAAANGKLYICYMPNTGNPVVKEYYNGLWTTIASNVNILGSFIYDTNTDRLYCDNNGEINGQLMGSLVYYKDGQWTNVLERNDPSGVESNYFSVAPDGTLYVTSLGRIWTNRVSTPTGIKNNQQKVEVKIYPNPTSDYLRLLSPEAIEVPLFAITGQILQTIQLQKNIETTIDISNLPTGTYFVGSEKISKL